MLLLVLALAGCATGPAFITPQALAPDAAALYVYRASAILGAGITHDLKMDALPVGTLLNGSYLRVENKTIERAATLASAGCLGPWQPLVLRPGKTNYVQLALITKTVGVGGRHLYDFDCQMLLRSEDEALPVLRGLLRAN